MEWAIKSGKVQDLPSKEDAPYLHELMEEMTDLERSKVARICGIVIRFLDKDSAGVPPSKVLGEPRELFKSPIGPIQVRCSAVMFPRWRDVLQAMLNDEIIRKEFPNRRLKARGAQSAGLYYYDEFAPKRENDLNWTSTENDDDEYLRQEYERMHSEWVEKAQ